MGPAPVHRIADHIGAGCLEANRIALEGVREEEKVGQRTTLDVLNAELEYLGSQIQLVTAKRDRVVAEYAIYASIGRLDAQSLGLSVPYYDSLETTRSSRTSGSGSGLRLRRPRTNKGLPCARYRQDCGKPFPIDESFSCRIYGTTTPSRLSRTAPQSPSAQSGKTTRRG